MTHSFITKTWVFLDLLSEFHSLTSERNSRNDFQNILERSRILYWRSRSDKPRIYDISTLKSLNEINTYVDYLSPIRLWVS